MFWGVLFCSVLVRVVFFLGFSLFVWGGVIRVWVVRVGFEYLCCTLLLAVHGNEWC